MQNPPPGQQNNATPAGSLPTATPATGSGLDPKVAAALSYIWIVGLIFFFIEKENKYIRFHALQSILFGIANSVIMVVLVIVAMILSFISLGASVAIGGGLGFLISLLVWLVWLLFGVVALALFLGLIFAAIKAYQGQMFKLPIIGNMAEKIVNKPAA
jgi:uncharacterized membrane protein